MTCVVTRRNEKLPLTHAKYAESMHALTTACEAEGKNAVVFHSRRLNTHRSVVAGRENEITMASAKVSLSYRGRTYPPVSWPRATRVIGLATVHVTWPVQPTMT